MNMKPFLATLALVACTLFCACGSNGKHDAEADKTRARIVGTVIDAATGAPVADVKVEGPDGRSTRSDAHGRFEFEDLDIGTTGELSAATNDGRKARNVLRPLAAGPLIVVLQLTRR